MDLHEKYHEETQGMPAVLLGVSSAAIAFAFHETADRMLSPSLLPIALAILFWALSFTAEFLYSKAYALGIKANMALNLADRTNNSEWRARAKKMFETWNRKAGRRYSAQQWLLIIGALAYLAGHS